jgi:mevalonate kinase
MDQLYKDAIELRHRLINELDDKSHPLARELEQGAQRLIDECEKKADARHIEDQVKRMQDLLRKAGDSPAISASHADELVDYTEDMKLDARRLM